MAHFANKIKTVYLNGVLESDDQVEGVQILLSAGPWEQPVSNEAEFSIPFHPHTDRLIATIVAPGYQNAVTRKDVKLEDDGTHTIGTIKLGKKTPVSKPRQRDGLVESQRTSNSNVGGTF